MKIGILQIFDPDQDGFNFELKEAKNLHCSINMFQVIRRKLLASKMKFFEQVIKMLETQLKEAREKQDRSLESQLPLNWCVQKHDKSLLKYVSEKGMLLSDIAEWIKTEDLDQKTQPELLFKRLKQLCELSVIGDTKSDAA